MDPEIERKKLINEPFPNTLDLRELSKPEVVHVSRPQNQPHFRHPPSDVRHNTPAESQKFLGQEQQINAAASAPTREPIRYSGGMRSSDAIIIDMVKKLFSKPLGWLVLGAIGSYGYIESNKFDHPPAHPVQVNRIRAFKNIEDVAKLAAIETALRVAPVGKNVEMIKGGYAFANCKKQLSEKNTYRVNTTDSRGTIGKALSRDYCTITLNY